MSNFRKLCENLLTEYDRDDPTDNFWNAAAEYKREKNKLYTQTVEPQDLDRDVVIKYVIAPTEGEFLPQVFWISSTKPLIITTHKEKGMKFKLKDARDIIKKHPKFKKRNLLKNDPREYEVHLEIDLA